MSLLYFSTSSELLRLPAGNLVYIKADGNYSCITVADGEEYVLTMQLGQIERRIQEMVDERDPRFIRLGKSLIINTDFITLINPVRQRMVLSDGRTFRYETSASREALKALKDLIEEEAGL